VITRKVDSDAAALRKRRDVTHTARHFVAGGEQRTQ
jgi:hypothetical protein